MASGEEERRSLASVRDILLAVATVIPLTASVVSGAATLGNTRGLPTQGALVYASVLAHLRAYSDRGPDRRREEAPTTFKSPDRGSWGRITGASVSGRR